jgi:hypothetical protein
MPAALWSTQLYAATGESMVAGGTEYFKPAISVFAAGNYPENRGQLLVREPGVFSNMGIKIIANTAITSVGTLRFVKNGSIGNQVLTIGSGLTGNFYDPVNTDTVASGDLVTFRLSSTYELGITTITYIGNSSIFTATDTNRTTSRIMVDSMGVTVGISTADDYYMGILGQIVTYDTADTKTRACIPVACTARNAQVQVYSGSTHDATIVVILQVNSVDTALTISIGAGLSGYFEDTTHSVAIAADDKIDWHINANALTSGTFYAFDYALDLDTTDGKWIGGIGQEDTQPNGTTYFPVNGINTSGTESRVQLQATVQGRAQGLCIYVYSNSSVTNSHLRFRKNGVDGNNHVIITALTTGFFDDAQTDNFDVGDLINLSWVSDVSVGINSITWVGSLQTAGVTGAITVIKNTDPPASSETFNFTTSGLTPSSFSLTDGQSTVFSSLTPGSGFAVVETVPSGWEVSYDISNANPNTNITVGAGDNIIVTVTNTELATTGSGIYKIVPDKRNDTLWVDASLGTTEDVKIPDPQAQSAYIGE